MQIGAYFLLFGESFRADRLHSRYLPGGLALHTGDRCCLGFGSGDLLVVGRGLG